MFEQFFLKGQTLKSFVKFEQPGAFLQLSQTVKVGFYSQLVFFLLIIT